MAIIAWPPAASSPASRAQLAFVLFIHGFGATSITLEVAVITAPLPSLCTSHHCLSLPQATLIALVPGHHTVHKCGTDAAMFARESSEIAEHRQPTTLQSASQVRTPLHSMADSAYLVRFKGSDPPPELVIAERIEVHGEHLVFLRSDGSLAALFVLEIIESWFEIKL